MNKFTIAENVFGDVTEWYYWCDQELNEWGCNECIRIWEYCY